MTANKTKNSQWHYGYRLAQNETAYTRSRFKDSADQI